MPWRRTAVVVLAGVAAGVLVGLLERISGGGGYFSQLAFLMTVVTVRLIFWSRDSTSRDGSGAPRR